MPEEVPQFLCTEIGNNATDPAQEAENWRSSRNRSKYQRESVRSGPVGRAYATQVEALRRLRNGGSQFVRVEHVHLNEGGQAVIGNVKSPSRSILQAA